MRTRVAEIREMGRATQGVTLIDVEDGTRLSGVQRVIESDAENGNGHADGAANGGDAGAASGPVNEA